MASPGGGRWVSPLIVANGQLGKALKRTSHEVSLYKTGETWNSVAIYTNFCSPEIEINVAWQMSSDSHIINGNSIPI